jgi:hypothetical protein
MKKILLSAFIIINSVLGFSQSINFNSPTSGCVNQSFNFINTSPANYSYSWKVGNFIVSTSYNYSRSFTFPGNYSVSLISDNNGVKDTVTKIIQINYRPRASFHATSINSKLGDSVSYVNNSQRANSYLWDFGSSAQLSSSNLFEPTTVFNAIGQHPTKLVVASNNNCKDSVINYLPFIYTANTAASSSWSTNIDGYNSQSYEHDKGEVVKVTSDGSIIAAGSFNSAIFKTKFGFAANRNNQSGFYIAKYSKEGALKWLVKGVDTVPGAGLQNTSYRGSAKDVALDEDGNIFVTGWYGRYFKLYDNDGIGTPMTYPASFNSPGFLLKLNKDGVYQWHVTISAECENIGIDAQKNIYVAGEYGSSITLMKGTTASSILGLNNTSWLKPFIVKFDSLGNYIWSTNADYSSNNYYVELNDMEVTKSGDIYLTGTHGKAITFKSVASNDISLNQPNTYGSSRSNAFLAKYNMNGDVQWVHSIGTASTPSGNEFDKGNSIGIFNNNVYVGVSVDVSHSNREVIVPSSTKAPIRTSQGPFLLIKYDTDGDYLWSRGLNSNHSSSLFSNSRNTATFVDNSGSVYCSGYTSYGGTQGGTILFNTRDSVLSGNTKTLTVNNNSAFFVKYNRDGNLIWATTESGDTALPGVFSITPRSIAVDQEGHLLTTGIILGVNSTISTNQFSTNARDAFIAKYSPSANLEDDVILIEDNNYTFCLGATATIHFTSNVSMNSGNTYSLQISNSSGIFNSFPSVIASKLSNRQRDSITFSVPANLLQHRNYRVRVTSSAPNLIGNSIPVSITSSTPPTSLISAVNFCEGEQITLNGRKNHHVIWSPTTNILDSNSNFITVQVNANTTYIVTNTSNCYSVVDSFFLNKVTIDTNLNSSGITLSSNEPTGAHNWLNCQNNYSLILNQNNPTFTPNINGVYAAEITKNNCVDTTNCLPIIAVGLGEIDDYKEETITPNPFDDEINIPFECSELVIKDSSGKIVFSQEYFAGGPLHFGRNLTPGLYLISLKTESQKYFKLIKK